MRSYIHTFDHEMTKWIQNGPEWLRPIMLMATAVGHPVVTIGIAMALLGYGWARSNVRLVVAAVVASGTLGIGTLLKLLLRRERPLTDYVLLKQFSSSSFPSGHTVGSTVVFGLVAYLSGGLLPAPWNGICAGFLVLLIIAVGVSRIYLGAHYPSDVVGGWLLGLAGLLIIIFIVRPTL